MKYEVLYDTQINKSHAPKGSVIELESGTDEGYIKRLIKCGAIKEAALKDSTDSTDSSQGKAQDSKSPKKDSKSPKKAK